MILDNFSNSSTGVLARINELAGREIKVVEGDIGDAVQWARQRVAEPEADYHKKPATTARKSSKADLLLLAKTAAFLAIMKGACLSARAVITVNIPSPITLLRVAVARVGWFVVAGRCACPIAVITAQIITTVFFVSYLHNNALASVFRRANKHFSF